MRSKIDRLRDFSTVYAPSQYGLRCIPHKAGACNTYTVPLNSAMGRHISTVVSLTPPKCDMFPTRVEGPLMPDSIQDHSEAHSRTRQLLFKNFLSR